MAISIADFWEQLAASGLLGPPQLGRLKEEFGAMKVAEGASAKVLAEWLVHARHLSPYQVKVLLKGRSGPFFFGDYRVYDRIETGRLTGQFRATHTTTGHPVLLQFLTGEVTSDPPRWKAARARAEALEGVVSPFVARCFDLVDVKSYKFLVWEDLRGQTLADHLVHARLPAGEACGYARHLVQGLADLHRHGVIHGDVSPRNVWLDQVGIAHLLLDPARPLDVWHKHQGDAELLGRAEYFAPELQQPGFRPNPQTDLYGLGCTLYQMLTQQPPFPGGDLGDKMQRHANQRIAPLEPWGVPQPVGQVVAYLMAKNPEVRYPHAAAALEALAPLVAPEVASRVPARSPASLIPFETALHQAQSTRSQLGFTPPSKPTGPAAGAPQIKLDLAGGSRRGKKSGRAVQSPTASPTTDAAQASAATDASAGGNQRQQTLRLAFGLSGVGLLLIAAIVGVTLWGGRNGKPPSTAQTESPDGQGDPAKGAPATGASATGDPATGDPAGQAPVRGPAENGGRRSPSAGDPSARPPASAPKFRLVADDGHTPWAPPVQGSPIQLEMLPSGALAYLHLRPAALLAHPEGPRVLQALGPQFALLRAQLETAFGGPLEEVDRLLVALVADGDAFPRPAFSVQLVEPLDAKQLLARWGKVDQRQEGSEVYYEGAGWAYWPGKRPGQFAAGHPADIQAVIKRRGAPATPRSAVNKLLAVSDRDFHFTALFVPFDLQSTFFRDGRQFYFGSPTRLRNTLDWLLGDQLRAAMLSLHLGDEFYYELKLNSHSVRDQYKVAEQLRERMAEAPQRITDYIAQQLNPPSYWRAIAFRFPPMVGRLHKQTRVQAEGDLALLNGVLPGFAAHNLVLASELLLASAPGAPPTAVAAAPSAAAQPKTIDELLQAPVSVKFPQLSLEFAMQAVAQDVMDRYPGLAFPAEIKILGGDLQLNGITRNQQIRDFDATNLPLAQVLTDLVRKANPDPTATGPADEKQKLIWVVGPDPADANREIILITTRDAAKTKQYDLPKRFRDSES